MNALRLQEWRVPDREPAQSGGDDAQLRAAVARFSAALGACDAEPGLASIGELIAALEGVRSVAAVEGERWRVTSRALAMVLQDRYDLGGDVGDLRRAAGLLRQVRAHPREQDVVAASVELASCLLELDAAGGGDADGEIAADKVLGEAIAVLEDARSADAASPAAAAECAYALGVALARRYDRMGAADDARRETEAFGEAVAFGGDGPGAKYRDGLAASYLDQWRISADSDWLDRAVAEGERALAACREPGDAFRVRRNLGDAFLERFRFGGRAADLGAAVAHLRAASGGMPDDPRFVVSYVAALLDADQAEGTDDHLPEALRLLEHLPTPPREWLTDYRAAQTNLGNALRSRFRRTGEPADLHRALGHHRAAVEGLRDSAPDAAIHLAMYGYALREHYSWTGDVADLEASAEAYARATAHAASAERADVRAAAGVGTLDAYRRTGDIAHLRTAIDFLSEAARSAPPESPSRPAHLADLSAAYRLRYLRTGELRDLERAIDVLNDAAESAPAASPDRGAFLGARGILWLDMFNHMGAPDGIDNAVADLTESVAAIPERAPRRADSQASLAVALILRSEVADAGGHIQADSADTDNAIVLLESALTLVPETAPARPGYLGNLGSAILALYRRDRRESDLDRTVELLEEAMRSTQEPAKDLAYAHRIRWQARHRDHDLSRAVELYENCCLPGTAQGPGQIADVAREWGDWALDRESWAEAARAYRYCLDTLTLLSAANAARHHKTTWLEPAARVPARIAYACARAGDPGTGAAMFEKGRAFLLNEAAEWRRALAADHPDLYARLGAALAAADAMAAAARTAGQDPAARFLPSGQVEQVNRDLDQILAEIATVTSKQAGHADSAPANLGDAWIIRLAPGPRSGVAIVTAPGKPAATAIPLPEAAEPAIGDRLTALRSAYEQRQTAPSAWLATLDEVAGWLGRAVGRPLADTLPPGADAVVIAGGGLGLLPLNAAWFPHRDQRLYLVEKTRIRHAPNLASARHAGRPPDGMRVLFIDDPRPQTLPIRSARLDPALVSRYFSDSVTITGAEATRDAVLTAMTQAGHDVLHLSCHARANPAQPMESAFLLAGDDTITVRDLFAGTASTARLAVLAGCETGVTGSDLPDEVLGLPTALIASGAAGVIASSWAIPDEPVTAVLLTQFYDKWQAGRDHPAEALRDAQLWVRDSTNEQKAARYPWYAAAYQGRTGGAAHRLWLSARSHRHPYWWAGFTYTGA